MQTRIYSAGSLWTVFGLRKQTATTAVFCKQVCTFRMSFAFCTSNKVNVFAKENTKPNPNNKSTCHHEFTARNDAHE
jgi:hypothetical protein